MDMLISDFFELLFTYAHPGAWNLATLLISSILVMSTSLCRPKCPLVANLLIGLLRRYTAYLCIYVLQWEDLNIMLPTFPSLCNFRPQPYSPYFFHSCDVNITMLSKISTCCEPSHWSPTQKHFIFVYICASMRRFEHYVPTFPSLVCVNLGLSHTVLFD